MELQRDFRVLPHDASELRPLSRWILDIARDRGLSAATSHDLDLCLHEAVSNIICHGCGDNREHRVTVRFEQLPSGIRLQVEDDASPFNPLSVLPLPVPRTLAETPSSGRGIPMLRLLTRELCYEFTGGRNLLTLYLAPEAPA